MRGSCLPLFVLISVGPVTTCQKSRTRAPYTGSLGLLPNRRDPCYFIGSMDDHGKKMCDAEDMTDDLRRQFTTSVAKKTLTLGSDLSFGQMYEQNEKEPHHKNVHH